MVARWRFSLLRTSVPVSMLGLLGCGGGSGGGPTGPTGPTEGTLEIVSSTAGSDLDPDGYSLTVDEGAANPLAPNGADTVASLAVGNHTVTLAGVASNCTLGGDNPRSVEIAAGSMASLRFEVACSQTAPTTGAVQISVATTGEGLDPDGYEVALDGGAPDPLSINGSVLISGLTPGNHEVALSNGDLLAVRSERSTIASHDKRVLLHLGFIAARLDLDHVGAVVDDAACAAEHDVVAVGAWPHETLAEGVAESDGSAVEHVAEHDGSPLRRYRS